MRYPPFYFAPASTADRLPARNGPGNRCESSVPPSCIVWFARGALMYDPLHRLLKGTRFAVLQLLLAGALLFLAVRGWSQQGPGRSPGAPPAAASDNAAASIPPSPQLIAAMVAHEAAAADHRGHYFYLSEERSDRTGGHLWQERVAETNWGKVRFLVAEDGHPLTGDRLENEKRRIAGEAADPEAFRKSEQARIDDEQHAKEMLQLLPKAFLFDPATRENGLLRVNFRPNPAYAPQTLEERVLHGMSGFVLIEPAQLRLHEVSGRMLSDVSIGFGLLATIHAGSNFLSIRIPLEGSDWKTQTLHTDIKGRALFLKTIAREQDSHHTGFQKIDDRLSLPDAVTLLERDPQGDTLHTR